MGDYSSIFHLRLSFLPENVTVSYNNHIFSQKKHFKVTFQLRLSQLLQYLTDLNTKRIYKWYYSPLIRQTDPLYLVSCKQQRSTFCHASISTISLALPLIFPTFAVPKRIQHFPAASCTNNSFTFDADLLSIGA